MSNSALPFFLFFGFVLWSANSLTLYVYNFTFCSGSKINKDSFGTIHRMELLNNLCYPVSKLWVSSSSMCAWYKIVDIRFASIQIQDSGKGKI